MDEKSGKKKINSLNFLVPFFYYIKIGYFKIILITLTLL